MNVRQISVILLLSLIAVVHGQEGKCEYEEEYNGIDCLGISGLETLTEQLDNAMRSVMNLSIFIRGNQEIPCLPLATIAKAASIKEIRLSGLTLPSFNCPEDKDQGSSSISVNTLAAYYVRGLQTWDWKEVARYTRKSLQAFGAQGVKGWGRLPSEFQEIYGPDMEFVSIVGSQIRWLNDSSLACPRCKMIQLNGNEIRELRKEIFGKEMTQLISLHIVDNEIESLPDDLFENFKPTEEGRAFHLFLDSNPLKELRKEIFDRLPSKYAGINIYVDNKKGTFQCTCGLDWLAKDGRFYIDHFWCTNSDGAYSRLKDYLQRPECQKRDDAKL